MLHTKIICTKCTARDRHEVLENLADAGMNVARLNFSHGTHESHRKIVEKIRLLNKNREFPVAILLDTKGPEIRTGDQHMKLITESSSEGQTLTLCQIIEESFKDDPKILGAVGELKSRAYRWYRRDNQETVTENT